jgi:hypothetical protein
LFVFLLFEVASNSSNSSQRLSAIKAAEMIKSWVDTRNDDEDMSSIDSSESENDVDLENDYECTDSDESNISSEDDGALPQAGPSHRGRNNKKSIHSKEDRSRSENSIKNITSTEHRSNDTRSAHCVEEVAWSKVEEGSTLNNFRFVPPQQSGLNPDIIPTGFTSLFCLKALFYR